MEGPETLHRPLSPALSSQRLQRPGPLSQASHQHPKRSPSAFPSFSFYGSIRGPGLCEALRAPPALSALISPALPLAPSLAPAPVVSSLLLQIQTPSYLRNFVLGAPSSRYSAGLRAAPAHPCPQGLLEPNGPVATLTVGNDLVSFGLCFLFTDCPHRPEYNLHEGEVCPSGTPLCRWCLALHEA